MMLSDKDIVKLIKQNMLVIVPTPKHEDIRGPHVNLHLSNKIIKYKHDTLDLKDEYTVNFDHVLLDDGGYKLKPSEFILGSTIEKVSIPNGYFGLIETKGNIARAGIQAHNKDGHIDPGFSGNITLEIKNNSNSTIIIYPNMAFAYLYILKLSSNCLYPYNGMYQNQEGATAYKKD